MTTARIVAILAAAGTVAILPASAPAKTCRSGSVTIHRHHITCKKAKRVYRGFVRHTGSSPGWVCTQFSTKASGSCVNTRSGASMSWN